jgi:hypothetical protein
MSIEDTVPTMVLNLKLRTWSMFENIIERMDDARNIAEHSKQNIEPELSRQSDFEEYANRGQEDSKKILNGSLTVKAIRYLLI